MRVGGERGSCTALRLKRDLRRGDFFGGDGQSRCCLLSGGDGWDETKILGKIKAGSGSDQIITTLAPTLDVQACLISCWLDRTFRRTFTLVFLVVGESIQSFIHTWAISMDEHVCRWQGYSGFLLATGTLWARLSLSRPQFTSGVSGAET